MALFHINFSSKVLGMDVQMNVIYPQATDREEEGVNFRSDGYPVLYLLHGMGSDYTSWCRRTSIERYATAKGLAVIMPEVLTSWYTDMAYGPRYWTFVAEELPQIVHEFFPRLSTKREDTFAAGLSMGGYGALKLGLLKPDAFSHVAPLSGGLDVVRICRDIVASNEPQPIFEQVFGSLPLLEGSPNDLFAAAETLAKSGQQRPQIYMWCGTEDFLYEDNIRMKEHLLKLGYDLTYEESPGDHSYGYWDRQIQTVLDWLPL